ncbi:MAG: hypothetical protein KJO98_16530 [Rhodothermia bacterium]|nr:hypothetical protein [Rhodothermia bacterium]
MLHVLWALPCLAGTVFLAFADGHPPGLIFVPVALAVWLLGHGVLWITRSLGERAQFGRETSLRWPVSIVAAVAGTGVASFLGILAMAWPLLGGAGLTSSQIPYIAGGWVVHATAFAGLLTGKPWGRWLAGILAAGWGGVVAAQIVDHLAHARTVEPMEMVAAVSMTTLLFLIGGRLIFGARPREFTRGGETSQTVSDPQT